MTTTVEELGRIQHGGSISEVEWSAMVRSIFQCVDTIREHRYVVEVGTLSGVTTAGIMRVLDALSVPSCVATIDKEPTAMARWGANAKPLEKKLKVRTEFHLGDSSDILNRCFGKRKIAWAFVDGCHCEECVKKDIEALAGRMPVGGTICFHDAANQRELEMLVHERYHGDGLERKYGVSEAILGSVCLEKFKLKAVASATKRAANCPTPIRGGLQVWEKYCGEESSGEEKVEEEGGS